MPPTRRRGLTDKMLAAKKREAKRYIEADPELRGHYIRVPPDGPIVFTAVARSPLGKQIWASLGTAAELKIDQARERAREAIRRIKAGKPAIEPPKPKPESVALIAGNWLTRHVEKNKHRTAPELRRVVEKYVLPYWADRTFTDIRRSDIAALLDVIEDKHGPAMADAVLTVLRSIATWVQSRDDTYVPPFAKGMRRVPKEVHRRSRVLNDDELRAVWRAAGDDRFGALVKLLLLSAQRKEKTLTLRWDDISADGVWTIRTEPREKGNAGKLQLPKVALDTIQAQPRFVSNPFVFAASRGAGPWRLTNWPKRRFDAKSGVTNWRLHDLRRTARSLMSRAGVQSEHAERTLGHSIRGVEGVYNRYSYDAEKADALRKLAALIERIVNPPPENVVALHEAVS
jgi:integrase